jgi:hypothetical protein
MTKLEYAEQRMQQKWYALAMAEQQGAAVPVLERLYSAYVLAMEEYNRCRVEQEPEEFSSPVSFPLQKKKAS